MLACQSEDKQSENVMKFILIVQYSQLYKKSRCASFRTGYICFFETVFIDFFEGFLRAAEKEVNGTFSHSVYIKQTW